MRLRCANSVSIFLRSRRANERFRLGEIGLGRHLCPDPLNRADADAEPGGNLLHADMLHLMRRRAGSSRVPRCRDTTSYAAKKFRLGQRWRLRLWCADADDGRSCGGCGNGRFQCIGCTTVAALIGLVAVVTT
jgi:hypothetical protein